jgi:hypothetical protein
MFRLEALSAFFLLFVSAALVGCGGAPAPDGPGYRYVFEESNETPHALAATLFHAIRTDDEGLWEKYIANADELRAREEDSRSRSSDEDIQNQIESIKNSFAELRDELRYEHGVYGSDRTRFLRSYAPYYSPVDSIQRQTVVDYTFQGHYISAIGFRDMIKTDRGWVLAESSRHRDDVQRPIPVGIAR